MHPSVRSADAAAKCGECGMALVPIPNRPGDSYWLDVATEPEVLAPRHPIRLRLIVREAATGEAVKAFERVHEQPLHLFIVSSDLRDFEHLHPSLASDGSFSIAVTLPGRGAYRLVADLLPTGGSPQTLQHTLVTSRQSVVTLAPAQSLVEELEATDEGVRARLNTGRARAGDDAHVVLEVADAGTGAAVTDLEPYLGAMGHMFLASEALDEVAHSHPILQDTALGGPTVTFQTLFARGGWYRVWAQVQRRGRLLTFRFTVRIPVA